MKNISEFEFHDATLASCCIKDGKLTLILSPAYIKCWEGNKCRGVSYRQDIQIVIYSPEKQVTCPDTPEKLNAGTIKVGSDFFDELIPVPFDFTGNVCIVLYLNSGVVFERFGIGVNIDTKGKREFFEMLPCDMAPG